MSCTLNEFLYLTFCSNLDLWVTFSFNLLYFKRKALTTLLQLFIIQRITYTRNKSCFLQKQKKKIVECFKNQKYEVCIYMYILIHTKQEHDMFLLLVTQHNTFTHHDIIFLINRKLNAQKFPIINETDWWKIIENRLQSFDVNIDIIH